MAFTLLELMAGMIVSGIVLVAAWTLFYIVSRRAHSSVKQKEQAQVVSFFHRCLLVDFETADSIGMDDNKSVLSFYSEDSRKLEYEFAGSYVVRKSESHTDTFMVTASTPEFDIGEDNSEITGMQFKIVTEDREEEVRFARPHEARSKFNIHD